MTEHHHAILAAAKTYASGLRSPPPITPERLAALSGVQTKDVEGIVRDLRAAGSWPEGGCGEGGGAMRTYRYAAGDLCGHDEQFAPDGEYVPAEVAERLYRVLSHVVKCYDDRGSVLGRVVSLAEDAIKFADEYGATKEETK